MLERLETKPLDWGDPEYRTRKKDGQVCHGILYPLIVHYVVFKAERAVVILNIEPLPGSALE